MSLADKKVLVLAADLFEDVELLYPVYRLREEGVSVTVAGLDDKPVTGKKGHGPLVVGSQQPGAGARRRAGTKIALRLKPAPKHRRR